jgi:regulation of enolase protein 1 (concanavalin A-like superfamily)
MHRRLVVVFAFACLASTRASADWQTINSKAGGFTVDFPATPTEERNENKRTRGGNAKFYLIGCETDRGDFLAFRIDVPGNVLAGSEERVLDQTRDLFAEIMNGRVVSEKKIGVRGWLGRDFTIRGRPDDEGDSTIRIREFLTDRAIFAVAVVSPPNQELPDETGRFLGSLALGEARVRASATPEPEVRGTPLAGWGNKIDPDNDCKFVLGDKSITFEVPPTLHDLGGPKHIFNAPRVMQETNGDFAVSVRVGGEFKPGPGSNNPGSLPYIAAGIVLWVDSHNFIRLERAAMLRNNQIIGHIAFLEHEGGYGGANHSDGMGSGPCYLRLERRGSRIYGGISNNGRDWKWLKPIDIVWPDRLKVGLMAITTSSSPFVPKFEEYEHKNTPSLSPASPASRGGGTITPRPRRGSGTPNPPPRRDPDDFENPPGGSGPGLPLPPPPPPGSATNSAKSDSGSSSTGAIVALVLAVVVGIVGLIVIAVVLMVFLSKSKKKPIPKNRKKKAQPPPRRRRDEYEDDDGD